MNWVPASRRVLGSLVVLTLASAALAGAGDDVQDAIKKLKASKKAADRALWARVLGGRAEPLAVEALSLALQDRDGGVREAAASALWQTGKQAKAAEPALRKALDDPLPSVVVRAAGALETMEVDPKELAPARRRALADARPDDDHTAFLAARGLIGIDPPAAVLPGLLGYLAATAAAAERPRGWDYREGADAAEKAVARLAAGQDRSAIPLLLAELERAPASAPSLLRALATYKPPPDGFAPVLVDQMRARSAKTRRAALERARELTGDADVALWAPEAAGLLRDPEVRGAALGALQAAGGRAADAVPDVVRLLRDAASVDVRRTAAETLGALGDAAQAIPQRVKARIAEQAKAALVAAFVDPDEDTGYKAAEAYNRLFLPPSEAVLALVEAAESRAPVRVRERALLMLRNRAGQARPVLERVRALAQSPEKSVADEARSATESIQSGAPGSPRPVVTGATGRAATGPAGARAGAAPESDPDVEARGLARLREMKLEFTEWEFARSLSNSQPEAIRAFLDAGMPPGLSLGGFPPLRLLLRSSCSNGRTPDATRDLVKILLAKGADVNQIDEVGGNTALMTAADMCDRATVRVLLAAGAKIDIRNATSSSALEGGIVRGNPAVEELIAAGARLDAKTARDYLEFYKDNPWVVALVKKASPR